MKSLSRIRIITMSLVALVALGFATKTFAAVNMYLEITDADGKVTKVTVAKDGSFTSPALKKGSYSFSWGVSNPTPAGSAGRGINSPMGGGEREAVTPSVSEITVSYDVKSPRDAASGLATGKRIHKPYKISIGSEERLLPTVNKKLGSLDIDEDCDGITGKIVITNQNGKPSAVDDWSAPVK